ncbi:MAG: phosphate/phosphite/phosphonate ABC transporter substrate-binding protein [Sulfuricella sp.]|nr:phosphate/phosphite/phosphonate ABC transporter substrate-binding protein [Sulfuricella sp.]
MCPIRTRFLAWRGLIIALCAGVLLQSCGNGEKADYQPQFGNPPATLQKKEYLFGVHPLHNPKRLLETYGPIVDRLNARIPEVHFSLEASRNYEEYEKKLYARHFDLALPNPYQTVNAVQHGYRVFGKMGDDGMFRGVFIVRRDSRIRSTADLRGKAISFPAKTALAATMMPQQFLHERGLPVSGYEARYVGSQESSIMNVYLGDTAAGATWPPPWIAFKKDHHDIAEQLKILWMTEPLLNNGLVARDDFPPELLKKVADILFTLHDSTEGRDLLARLPLSRFEAANDATYQPVSDFIGHFTRTVRPLDE